MCAADRRPDVAARSRRHVVPGFQLRLRKLCRSRKRPPTEGNRSGHSGWGGSASSAASALACNGTARSLAFVLGGLMRPFGACVERRPPARRDQHLGARAPATPLVGVRLPQRRAPLARDAAPSCRRGCATRPTTRTAVSPCNAFGGSRRPPWPG